MGLDQSILKRILHIARYQIVQDLFAEKIKHVHIENYFTRFHGEKGFDAGIEFFTRLFVGSNSNKERQIYVHITNAIDSNNIHNVFEACTDIVLKINIRNNFKIKGAAL